MSVLITSVAFVIKCPFCLQMLILLRFAFGRLNSVSLGFFRFYPLFNNIRKPHEVTAKSFKFQFVYFGYTILGVVKACFTTILGVVACQNAVHYYHFGITSENLNPVYYYHFGIDILYIAIGYAFYLAALLVFHSNEKEYILGCLKLAPLRTVIKPDAVNSSICRLSVCSAIPYFFAAESGNTNSRWPPLSIDMH